MVTVKRNPRMTGDEFKFIRKSSGFSATKLAEALQKNSATIQHWESMLFVADYQAELLKDIIPIETFDSRREFFRKKYDGTNVKELISKFLMVNKTK